jgi:glycosyltransferase involved in cell wall biosynthesis
MLIEDGVSGLLTPVGDDNAFYQAMKRIADDPTLASEFSENAKNARSLYSEEIITQKYFDYFGLVSQNNTLKRDKNTK